MLLLLLLLLEYRKRRPGSNHPNRTIATNEIPTCREAGSALFTMSYEHIYTCLAWQIPGPCWIEGHESQEGVEGL